MRTTSGRNVRARSIASRPSAASPTTVMSLSASSSARSPLRTSRVVVGEQDPDHDVTAAATGRVARTRNPPSIGPASSTPPSSRARSRMLTSPCPGTGSGGRSHSLTTSSEHVGADPLDLDADPAGRGVPDGVRQCLLHDPVDRPRGAGRQVAVVGPQVHLPARRPDPLDEVLQVGRRRARTGRPFRARPAGAPGGAG